MKIDDQSFRPQFAPSEIDQLDQRYLNPDCVALDAGHSISDGDHSRKNLETIFRWKTNGRGVSRLSQNTDAEIDKALRSAVAAINEREAMAALRSLHGVGVPVASAILTAINPERYTVIDFRALESLGIKRSLSVDFYLTYLKKCRDLAREYNVSLRKLDRALWQWSKEQAITKSLERERKKKPKGQRRD